MRCGDNNTGDGIPSLGDTRDSWCRQDAHGEDIHALGEETSRKSRFQKVSGQAWVSTNDNRTAFLTVQAENMGRGGT
jgi:hypothetical protein